MLSEYLEPENIIVNLDSSDRDECLAELLETLVNKQPEISRREALENLMVRESKMSTAVYPYVAVPHCLCKSVKKSCVAIGISKSGIDFGSTQVSPEILNAKIIFEILFEENDTQGHLNILRDVLHLVENKDFIEAVLNAKSSNEVYSIIEKSEV